jgi:hypothetical protein
VSVLAAILLIAFSLLACYTAGYKLRPPKFLMPGPYGFRDLILPPVGAIGVLGFLIAVYSHSGWLGFSSLMLAAVSMGLYAGIRKSLGY